MSDRPLELHLDTDDWSKLPLSKVSELIKDGTHGTHVRVSSGIPLLSAKNITPYGDIAIDDDDSLISLEDYEKIHAKYELSPDDLLITVVGTLGRRALFLGGKKFSIQRSVGVVRCKKSKLLPRFLYQFTEDDYFQRQLVLRSNATAQAGVYLGELSRIDIALPPLPEQQKIATILSAVDDVIEKTRAQIDKLKDLKTGMMQDLLTKGIGPGGVPHTEFKDSAVGRIPAGWDVVRLDQLAKVGSSKRIRQSEYVSAGVPFFRSKEVIRRSKGLEIEKTLYINRKRFDEIARKFGAPVEGDILVTAVGTIGTIYLVENREFYFKDGNLLWLRNISSSVSPKYLASIMQSEAFQAEIDRVTGGSSQAALTIEKIQELTVVLPPLEEQSYIVNVLSSLDEKYYATLQKLAAQQQTKKALMQDLLSGRVRVNVDNKESVVA
jgi:type I restriction enzyme S subunit